MKRISVQAILMASSLAAVLFWSVRPAYPSSTDLLQFLPDGKGVVVVDFQRVAASSLWASGANQKGIKDTLEKIQPEITGLIDPSDLRTIVVAIESFDLRNLAGVATGSFNQSDVLARLKADSRIKLSSEKYQGLDLYHLSPADASGTRKNVAFVFYDPETVIVGSTSGVKASVDTKAGGKNSLAQNAALTAALAEAQPGAIRFAMSSAMTSGLQSSELPIPDFSSVSLIFGTVDVTSGMDFNATLRSDSGEHAKAIADRLNGLLSMAKGYLSAAADPKLAQFAEALKTVSITNAEADVKVSGSVSMELLSTLLGGARKG